MKPHVRTAVAAIALSHFNDQKISSVYAYDTGHLNVEVSVTDAHVKGYDYTNGCHIEGTIPNIYHYGEANHIEFRPKGGGRYDGYDYGSGSHFEVSVRKREAKLYDYGAGEFFTYSC